MEKNIGFIGVGAMGYAMAMNVRKHMVSDGVLYVYDVNSAACEKLKADYKGHGSIEIVQTAKDVSEHCSTVISIVPAGEHVKQVYLDPVEGILAAKSAEALDSDRQRLYLECSTIDIDTTKLVGESLAAAGMGTYVDCPVSGGVPAAERGSLSFMLGADDTASHDSLADRLRTICHLMGNPDKIFFCGSLGKGLAAKLCNNYLSCSLVLANSEAMATGLRLGVNKHVLHKIIHESTGQNFMADHVSPVPGVVAHAPSSNNYKLGFKAQMLSKDIGLAIDAAQSVGIDPKIGRAAMEVFELVAQDKSCSDLDGSIVYKFIGGTDD